MKHPWLAYLIVALLSIGAGVAIVGLPDDDSAATTIVVSPTTGSAAPTSEGATSVVETTAPAITDPTTTVEATVPDATTTTSTSSTSTSTSTSTTTTTPDVDLPPRSELFTIVANGANISGAAGRNVERLEAIGYTDIAPRNGTVVVDFTIVYYADGLEDSAVRLADDLELFPEFVAPLIDAPQVLDLPDDVQLLAYIGLDRAG